MINVAHTHIHNCLHLFRIVAFKYSSLPRQSSFSSCFFQNTTMTMRMMYNDDGWQKRVTILIVFFIHDNCLKKENAQYKKKRFAKWFDHYFDFGWSSSSIGYCSSAIQSMNGCIFQFCSSFLIKLRCLHVMHWLSYSQWERVSNHSKIRIASIL